MTTPPNIIVILADDLGYGDLGCFGNPDVRTPALDALAGEGVRLTQQYSASVVCAPARAGLLTGRYPHRTGAIDTLEGRGLDRLAIRERTLGDCFQAAGYVTGLFGKWHLGALDAAEGHAYHPNKRGFHEFAGFRGGWADYWDWRLDRNGGLTRADGRYLTDVITHEAVDFIDRHAQTPFFLHVTYNAPHYPLQVPDSEADSFRETGKFHEAVCRLYGMVSRMDAGVARILERLDQHGLTNNTLVLFTSDNGPQLNSKEFGPESLRRFNGFLKGQKCSVYEGGIRVPALLRWPDGGLDGGRTIHDLVHFTDWLPTLVEAAGLPLPSHAPLDGQSVLGILRGQPCQNDPVRFWQWNRYAPVAAGNAAVRDGNWKLVRPSLGAVMQMTPGDVRRDETLKYDAEDAARGIDSDPIGERLLPDPLPAPLLFDLGADPYEQHDLAAAHPDRVRRMQAALDTWFDAVEADRQTVWAEENRAAL